MPADHMHHAGAVLVAYLLELLSDLFLCGHGVWGQAGQLSDVPLQLLQLALRLHLTRARLSKHTSQMSLL